MQDVHIRGWTILGVSVVSFLVLVYVVLMIRRIHRRVESLDLTSDKSAMAEAVSAHSRIDRIDTDLKVDHAEVSLLRVMINAVKGQVKFLLHKDISTELERQATEAANKEKSE